MRVLLVDDRHERICHLQETLESDGHVITGNLSVEADLVNAIRGQQPDVIVIDLLNLSAAGLEGIARINRESPYPIVMFTADGSSKSIQKAVAAGISAYVVDGFNEQRITPILEIAVARFRKLRGLEVEKPQRP